MFICTSKSDLLTFSNLIKHHTMFAPFHAHMSCKSLKFVPIFNYRPLGYRDFYDYGKNLDFFPRSGADFCKLCQPTNGKTLESKSGIFWLSFSFFSCNVGSTRRNRGNSFFFYALLKAGRRTQVGGNFEH